MKTTVTSIILLALLSVNSVAQEYMHWGLPEGAKMRIGRGAMKDLAYSPDGARLAIASSVGVWLYDTATLKEVDLLAEHTGEVLSVAYSPDSSLLASGSKDRTMRLWDTKTGEQKHPPLWHGPDVVNVEFSPDGTALASSSGDQAQIWDAKTVEERYRLIGHTHEVSCIAFSPDGNVLATGSKDQTVRVWDAKTGKQLRMILAHTRSVSGLAFSPDGNNKEIWLWDARTGNHLHKLTGHKGPVHCLGFSPDGTTLASGGGHQRNTRCVSGILKQAKICTRILCIRRWSVAWRSVRMAGLSPVQAATAAWHCGIPAPGRICGH